MSGALVARVVLVLAALGAILVLAGWQRSEDACTDSVKAMFFALRDDAPDARLDETIDSIEADCDGTSRLVDAGAVLFQQDEPERAARVLRTAVDREPDSFSAWAGLAAVLRRADPGAAADAAARARALNRFYRPAS